MLTVNDLMTVTPRTVRLTTPLIEVLEIMRTEGCRQLPVIDKGELVGIITDRDIRSVLTSPIFLTGSAEAVMTPDPITVTPDTPGYRAAEMLSLYKFGALPVVDGKQLVGIVTVTDFLEYFKSQAKRDNNQT